MEKKKKIFSFLLSLTLTVSYLPYTTVLAEDNTGEPAVEETQQTDESEQPIVEAEETNTDSVSLYSENTITAKSQYNTQLREYSTVLDDFGVTTTWLKRMGSYLLLNTTNNTSQGFDFVTSSMSSGSVELTSNDTYKLQKYNVFTGQWDDISGSVQYDITYPVTVVDNLGNTLITGSETNALHVGGEGYSFTLDTTKTVNGKAYKLTGVASNVGSVEPDTSTNNAYTVTSSEYSDVTVTAAYEEMTPATAYVEADEHVKNVTIADGETSPYTLSPIEDSTITVTVDKGYVIESAVWSNDPDYSKSTDLSLVQKEDDKTTYNGTIEDPEEGEKIYIKITTKKNTFSVAVGASTADHATIKVNGTTVAPKESVDISLDDSSYTVTVTPDEGYIVDTVFFETDKLTGSALTYENTTASVTVDITDEYKNWWTDTFTADIKEAFTVSDGDVTYYEGITQSALIDFISNRVIKSEACDCDAELTLLYDASNSGRGVWKALDYTPASKDEHAFGKNGTTETIQAAYNDGGKHFTETTKTFKINLTDDRKETKLSLNSGISLEYDDKKDLDDALYESIIKSLKDEDDNELDYSKDDFTFTYPEETGKQTVTVTWNPTGDMAEGYKPTTATVDVTFTKGESAVTVNSQMIKPGETIATPLITCDPETGKAIGFIVGSTTVDLEADGVTLNDLAGKEVSSGDRTLVEILGENNTLSELRNKIASLKDADQDNLNAITNVIDEIIKIYPNAANAEVTFSTVPTTADVYTVWGISICKNYKPATDTGTIIITSDPEQTKLSFKNTFKNNLVTLADAAKDGYFDYTYEGSEEVTQIILKGGKQLDSVPAELGTYTQIVRVDAEGIAISRTFIIKKDASKVTISEIKDRYYDTTPTEIEVSVKDIDANKDISYKSDDLTIQYIGVDNDYNSATAPSNAGTYYVSVTYKGNDTCYPSASKSNEFTIKKIDTKVTYTIGSKSVEYGQEYSISAELTAEDETQISKTLANKLKDGLAKGLYCKETETYITDGLPENVGTYTFTSTQNAVDAEIMNNFTNDIIIENGKLTITKATTKITINGIEDGGTIETYYTGSTQTPTGTVFYAKSENGKEVKDAVAKVSYAKKTSETAAIANLFITTANAESNESVLPLDAGEYTVTAVYDGDDNHLGCSATVTLKIKKIDTDFTYTIKDKSVVYGDEIKATDFTTTLTAKNKSQVTDDLLKTIKGYLDQGLTWEAAPTVGTYKVSTNGEVYEDIWKNFTGKINTTEGTLTVTKRPITLKVTGSKVKGEKEPAYMISIASGSLAYNDTLASLGTIKRMSGEGIGTYGFTVENMNKNYDVKLTKDSLFTITEKSTPTPTPTTTPSSKKNSSKSANTGDTSNLVAPMITIMVSGAAIFLLIRKRKSYNN